MKPLYFLLLFYALFITGLADSLEVALFNIGLVPNAIPVVGSILAAATAPIGIGIGLTVSWCINITMGSGLMLLLLINRMYHPKWGPAGLIGAFIPGLDSLPFWVGIVIAGIVYDMSQEGGLVGAAAGMVQAATTGTSGSVTGALQGAKTIVTNARTASMPQAPANDNQQTPQERTQPTLQTKNFDGIKPYVPKAA